MSENTAEQKKTHKRTTKNNKNHNTDDGGGGGDGNEGDDDEYDANYGKSEARASPRHARGHENTAVVCSWLESTHARLLGHAHAACAERTTTGTTRTGATRRW